MKDEIVIAMPKGKVLKGAAELFAKIGFDCKGLLSDSRRLIFKNPKKNVSFMIVRASDVPAYVEYGAADMGVCGKDVLLEQNKTLYEPLDLKIGKCRMVVAEPKNMARNDDPAMWSSIRIATKFPNITEQYFQKKGVQVEVIKLYGSIELAPLVGLSERIVDLVETGETLRQNGLVEVEKIFDVTSRLIVNRASLKIKHERVREIIEKLKKAIAER